MLVGGYRALRQNDLKLLLAFGTVSQLGFLMVLVGAGSCELAAAGLAMTVAHALFKSTLFLTVGRHRPRHRHPRPAPALRAGPPAARARRRSAALAAASMAGLPPLLGLRRQGGGLHRAPGRRPARPHRRRRSCWPAWSLGSVLTAAYSAALRVGRVRPQARAARHRAGRARAPRRARCSSPRPAVLALAGLVARARPARCSSRWSPATPRRCRCSRPRRRSWRCGTAGSRPCCCRRSPCSAVRRCSPSARRSTGCSGGSPSAPRPTRATGTSSRASTGSSVLVTGTTQRGSLPAYLGTILVVVLALPGTVLLTRAPVAGRVAGLGHPGPGAGRRGRPRSPPAMALRIRQRLSAVLVVGVTGYGVAVLFALQGAPDLALTQFLVETLTLVVFVLVLRKLPKDITERHRPRERVVRGVIAVAVGRVHGRGRRGRAGRRGRRRRCRSTTRRRPTTSAAARTSST